MELVSVTLRRPCRHCAGSRFRLEAERRDDCPVVCARCGSLAGTWGHLRATGVADSSEGFATTFGRIVGRTPRRRRR